MAGADWQAASLRIALFTQQALPRTTDVFTAFAGEPPDRQEDQLKAGIRHQVGKLDNAVLRATISPIRVDFILGIPRPTAEELMGEFSLSIGELKAELAKFERKILAWLPRWEIATTRVSLIVQARAQASSREAAYQILRDNLISVRVRPEEMRDLVFRVNWRARTGTIDEGYYNRLTTWQALQLMATATTGPGRPELTVQQRDFAQVDMDINTPAERVEPLPRDKLNAIYSEFFQLAVRVAEAGEGP